MESIRELSTSGFTHDDTRYDEKENYCSIVRVTLTHHHTLFLKSVKRELSLESIVKVEAIVIALFIYIYLVEVN